jgi:hypothetical protein
MAGGNSRPQVLNKTLGGNEDNVGHAPCPIGQENEAVIIENTDAALKASAAREIRLCRSERSHLVLQGQGVPVDIEYIPGTMLVGNGFPVLRGGKFIEQTNRFQHYNGRPIPNDDDAAGFIRHRTAMPLPPDLARYAFPTEKEKNVVDRLRR